VSSGGLKEFVAAWDEAIGNPIGDRELALRAIAAGYWSDMAIPDVTPNVTVAHVVDVVRRAVHKLRLGN
jgi:hypothetical protein